jgi:hypothetical protein
MALKSPLGIFALALALSAVSTAAAAHHSFATFDMSKTVTVKGTVRTFEWTNPHTWIWVEVPDDHGGSVTWGLEGAAPGELSRHGWSKHSINPGDKISVDVHPLKSGQSGGSFSKITFEDGHELAAGGPAGAGAPGAAAPPPN